MTFSSWACRCASTENIFIELLEAKYVFLATVNKVSDCQEDNRFEHELWIESVYKGKLPEFKNVYTDCITSCAFNLRKGSRYIFFTDLVGNNIEFCELRMQGTDDNFINAKKNLDKIKDAKLDYVKLYESRDTIAGYSAQLMAQNGRINGIVNIFNNKGALVLKGLMKNGKMQGYFEIINFTEAFTEYWTGDYKNGERIGNWNYKKIFNESPQKVEYIQYIYEDGEIVKKIDLDAEAQLKLYEPNKN
jgi:hypothetical protein